MKGHGAAAGGGTTVALCGTFVSFALAVGVRLLAGPLVPISGLAAILLSAILLTTMWRAPRFGIGAAIGAVLGLAPTALLGARWALRVPLVTTYLRCGTGDMGLPFVAAVFVLTGVAIALPVAALVESVGPSLHRVAFVLASALFVAAAVLQAVAVASLRRPDPDAFAKLAGARAPLDLGGAVTVEGDRLEYGRVHDGQAAPTDGYRVTRGTIVRALPSGDICTLQLSGTERDVAIDAVAADGVATDPKCPALDVVPMPRGYVVVRRGDPIDRAVLVAPDGTLDVETFRGLLGAPRGWVACGAIGIVLAALALGLGRRALRRARALARAVEAHHRGDGWVVVDGSACHFAELDRATPGPVTVALETFGAPTYRDVAARRVTLLARGSRGDAIAAARKHVTAWALVAASIVVIACAPLCAARLHGLL